MNSQAGRRNPWFAAWLIIAILAVLCWPVTTRFGVDYQWSSRRITVFEKAVQFLGRDLQARRLVAELTKGARSRDERLERLFDWTVQHVRPTPPGLPVVDDHVFHIIIRGYGAPDQRAEAFALLASYAGFAAGPAMLPAAGTKAQMVVTVVRDGSRRMVFDVNENVAFKRPDGTFADVREVRANPRLIPASAHSRTVHGIAYERYLENIAMVEPRFGRMEAQRPWLRMRQGVSAMFQGRK